jgi:hypothetical protein
VRRVVASVRRLCRPAATDQSPKRWVSCTGRNTNRLRRRAQSLATCLFGRDRIVKGRRADSCGPYGEPAEDRRRCVVKSCGQVRVGHRRCDLVHLTDPVPTAKHTEARQRALLRWRPRTLLNPGRRGSLRVSKHTASTVISAISWRGNNGCEARVRRASRVGEPGGFMQGQAALVGGAHDRRVTAGRIAALVDASSGCRPRQGCCGDEPMRATCCSPDRVCSRLIRSIVPYALEDR